MHSVDPCVQFKRPARHFLKTGLVRVRFAKLVATLSANLVAISLFLPAVNAQGLQPPQTTGITSTEAGIVNEATAVLEELVRGTATQIPESLLTSAEGVAIVPHYVRGAFFIGVAGGRGVLVMRDANRNWQAPEMISIGGGSIGWQAGVQATDLVLVFRSPRSLNNIRTGKLTLGANASAAAGPIGRYASAATDAAAQAEIFTYSKSRGLFAGISLDGASLQIDVPATQRYYQTQQGGPGVVPPSAIHLINELSRLSQVVPPPDPFVTPAGGLVQNVAPEQTGGTLPAKQTIAIQPGSLTALEAAVFSLLASVDQDWKLYLSLPISWKNATSLQVDEVYMTLARYERVDTNPQFAALKALPAFNQALSELRRLAALAPRADSLRLPPPPAVPAPGVR